MMEDKKVKMTPNTKQEQTKIPYEKLVDIVNQLQAQGKNLYDENVKLKEYIDNQGPVIRMEFLFKMLEHSSYFDTEAIEKAAKEIEKSMFAPIKEQEVKEDNSLEK